MMKKVVVKWTSVVRAVLKMEDATVVLLPLTGVCSVALRSTATTVSVCYHTTMYR